MRPKVNCAIQSSRMMAVCTAKETWHRSPRVYRVRFQQSDPRRFQAGIMRLFGSAIKCVSLWNRPFFRPIARPRSHSPLLVRVGHDLNPNCSEAIVVVRGVGIVCDGIGVIDFVILTYLRLG